MGNCQFKTAEINVKLAKPKHKNKHVLDRKSGTPLSALYNKALLARRTGSLYGAFPYPTKISAEAIALYIAAHTKPGATVFDGFAGSGTTGLAALLCENPTDDLRNEAARLGLNVVWGARNAVLYELGTLGAFVGKTLTSPPDPVVFREAAEYVLENVEKEFGWVYAAEDPDGKIGSIRHTVWSDVVRCPGCLCEATLWASCVSLDPARIESRFKCPNCAHQATFDDAERIIEQVSDDVTGETAERRARTIARIYGITGKKRWSRGPTNGDLALLDRIAREPIPECVPNLLIQWGDLYRSGYHRGISHLHQFYTRRNLIVFAHLWERASGLDEPLRDAIHFWLLSYNASHATIMTRVVAKSNQKDLVVTSAQPGVLYVSGLPVEKNLFLGLRRKLATISDAFGVIHGCKGKVTVHQKSSCAVDLPDSMIDYVFTDPPFGGNIPYAEINLLNESWLGRLTDRTEEVIISGSQGKTIGDYQQMLTSALTEINRILKPDGKATVVFHSASADVWNALQAAYSDARLNVEIAGVLDKRQGSFKQNTTKGAVRGDPLLLLGKAECVSDNLQEEYVWTVAEKLRNDALSLEPSEQTPHRLYSRLVSHFLANHQKVPMDADEFYRWHSTRESSRTDRAGG